MIDIGNNSTNSKIALVHDWLFGLRGGERCLQAFLCLYEDADVFSLFYKKNSTDQIIDSHFKSASFWGSVPGVEYVYRYLLPLFPFLSSNSNLADYKVKISLSHAASKNIRGSRVGTQHTCYCFTPMRYIWDQASRYLGWKSIFAWPLIFMLRVWDRRGSKDVTEFIAISNFVAARIRKYYHRRSTVIFPPVATEWLDSSRAKKPDAIAENEEAFLFAGALVPYKGAELAIKACTELNKELWVAGSGSELANLKSLAGPKVKFLGKVSDQEMAYLLRNCRALIFPCKEDFGILPLEAQAAGKPVIALYSGACKQTIKAWKHWLYCSKKHELASNSYSGVFIRRVASSEQLEEVKKAINFFEENQNDFSPEVCSLQAKKYSPECFYDAWVKFAARTPVLCNTKIVTKPDFVKRFESLR